MREYVNHYGAIRIRATGLGNLKATFYSQDKAQSQELVPLRLKVADAEQPTRLANFNSQRATLRISVTEIDEYFDVNRILVYSKTVYTGYATRWTING